MQTDPTTLHLSRNDYSPRSLAWKQGSITFLMTQEHILDRVQSVGQIPAGQAYKRRMCHGKKEYIIQLNSLVFDKEQRFAYVSLLNNDPQFMDEENKMWMM